MKKILIFKRIDIWNITNYNSIHKKFGNICPNFGNKLWYQGLISEISTPDNVLEYYDYSMKPEEINEKYDLVIYPMANIFSREFSKGLPEISDFIKHLKIPVFIISCGMQLGNNEKLNDLCRDIGEVSKEFITAVYETGGQFALRGYETARFFEQLGFKNPAVVGCPSLFQCGRRLNITKKAVDKERFKPAVNGSVDIAFDVINKYDNSIYYDQDLYANILYNSDYYDNCTNQLKKVKKIINYDNSNFVLSRLISEDRIKLIADMWDWRNSLISEDFSMSFGTRIHGNIMALLSGVPAIIVPLDIRVREMAEFYEIPHIPIDDVRQNKNLDLFDLFEKLDYTEFNKSFGQKYDEFQSFLIECGVIENQMNSDNEFFKHPNSFDEQFINQDSIELAHYILKHKKLCMMIKYFSKLKNTVKR